MKHLFLLFVTCYLLLNQPGICKSSKEEVHHLAQFVDTRIGVIDSRGSNCVIGPQVPFGSINPSPETPDGGNGGYAPGKPVRGFGQSPMLVEQDGGNMAISS